MPGAGHPAASAKRGCFFYGCLTAVIAGVIGIVILAVGGTWAAKKLQSAAITALTPYTEEASVPFPPLAASESDYKNLEAVLAAFRENLESNRPAQATLDTNDLEAILAFAPELRSLSPYGRIRVERNEVVGEVSIPMEKVPFVTIPGRHLNGTVYFTVASLPDGVLFIGIRDIKVKGHSLPEEFMRGLRAENLARRLYDHEDLGKIKDIQVKEGVITVTG